MLLRLCFTARSSNRAYTPLLGMPQECFFVGHYSIPHITGALLKLNLHTPSRGG
jgi:hypothetical protein